MTQLTRARTIVDMQLALWSDDVTGAKRAPAWRARSQDVAGVAMAVTSPRPPVPVPAALVTLHEQWRVLMSQARAPRTLLAYQQNWKLFARWCEEMRLCALPASYETLSLYLTHLAHSSKKYSTIRRARVAIGQVHAAAGGPRADQDPRLRTLERGIARTLGNREQGAVPVSLEHLESMTTALHDSYRDLRDRALLLLGFAGAFRASDLVVLDRTHARIDAEQMAVFVPRGKEDQLGRGRVTHIARAQNPTVCPVRAVEQWLAASPSVAIPLFPQIVGQHINAARMHPRSVTRALQRAAKCAAVEQTYTSHSLRAGLATHAYARGASDREIQEHGGWSDLRSLHRYIHLLPDPARINLVTRIL